MTLLVIILLVSLASAAVTPKLFKSRASPGLPNQDLLNDRVAQALKRADLDGSRVAVVLIGIDRFRAVTDSLGHSAGEALLAQFATILQEAVPDRTVARVGGDVFAIVVEEAGAVVGTVAWAQRQFRSASRHRFEVDGSGLYLAFSTGIALSGPGATAEVLVRNAEVAMSRAKQTCGAKVVAFEDRDLEAVRERLALETDLRQALAERQVRVAYQPVVRTDDHRVIGAEALARWYHPRHGEVPPDVFIPVVEALGLSSELTSLVLRTACAQVVRWKAEGRVADDFRVAVNLCADDLVNPKLVEEVGEVLRTSGLEPGFLALEVTETGLVRDPRHGPRMPPGHQTLGRPFGRRRLRDGLLVTVVLEHVPGGRGQDRQELRVRPGGGRQCHRTGARDPLAHLCPGADRCRRGYRKRHPARNPAPTWL